MLKLRIVQESTHWVVIDKPAGFHTHPPEDKSIRLNPRWNALSILERQLGVPLYPAHRLDRATSGLLLYSKNREINGELQRQFAEEKVHKAYYAILRGEFSGDRRIEEPLQSESGSPLPAVTRVEPAYVFTLPLPHPKGGDRRFTLARTEPLTGRFHQIRRHLARAGFPLLGDSRHGDKKLNREFSALTGCTQLFLRCMELDFLCPISGKKVAVRARWGREWHRLFELAGACGLTASPSREPPSLS